MPSRNLEPGQFQIGELIMGRFTLFNVEAFDIGNYDINVQDSQAQASDDTKFGQDTLKPSPIQLTVNFRKNKQLERISALYNDPVVLNFDDDPNLADLQREWRAEATRQQWGATKPLYFCGTDGVTRMLFGRPGKFGYKLQKIVGSQFYACQLEFRRLDTFAHSETEWFRVFTKDTPQSFALTRGNAPSWVRFVILGPAANPIINFGSHSLQLDTSELPGGKIAAGKVVEISSYPWSRRIVDSDGLSLAAYLISDNPYLAKVKFNDHETKEIAWTATATTSDSKMVLYWHDAYQIID